MKKILSLLTILVLVFSSPAFAADAGNILNNPVFQAVDSYGMPLAGGLLYSYEPGTTTARATYSDKECTVANTNPVVLDANGQAVVYLSGATKFNLTKADGTQALNYPIDYVRGVPDASDFLTECEFTGIDDNATETAITIDSDESVFIGKNESGATANPDANELIIQNNSTAGLSILGSSAGYKNIYFGDSVDGNDSGRIIYSPSESFSFYTADTLAFSIDSSQVVTFEEIPLGPASDPTTGNQLARKAYIDTQVETKTGITYDTIEATTSGSSVDFTGIPDTVVRITLMLYGLSADGTGALQLRLGDSGGVETTGYLGSEENYNNVAALSTGFNLFTGIAASSILHGQVVLTRLNASSKVWVASGIIARSDGGGITNVAGSKALSDDLTRVQVVTADTFDAGSVNICYE